MTVIRFAPGLKPVLKHASHDQSTHGNWAKGSQGSVAELSNNEISDIISGSTTVNEMYQKVAERLGKSMKPKLEDLSKEETNYYRGVKDVDRDAQSLLDGRIRFTPFQTWGQGIYVSSEPTYAENYGDLIRLKLDKSAKLVEGEIAWDKAFDLFDKESYLDMPKIIDRITSGKMDNFSDSDIANIYWAAKGYDGYSVYGTSRQEVVLFNTDKLTVNRADIGAAVKKHQQHDQKTHGNWADGITLGRMGLDPTNEDDVRKAFTGTLDTRAGKVSVVVDSVDVFDFSTSAQGQLVDSQNRGVGQWARTITPETGTMHNEALNINTAYQFKGIATEFQKHSEKAAMSLGMERIVVQAAMDGKEAWATERFGFDFAGPPGEGLYRAKKRVGRKELARPDFRKQIEELESRFDGPESRWPKPHEILSLGGNDLLQFNEYGRPPQTLGQFVLSYGWEGKKPADRVTKQSGLGMFYVTVESSYGVDGFVMKHGQHDQKTHGNWAHGSNTLTPTNLNGAETVKDNGTQDWADLEPSTDNSNNAAMEMAGSMVLQRVDKQYLGKTLVGKEQIIEYTDDVLKRCGYGDRAIAPHEDDGILGKNTEAAVGPALTKSLPTNHPMYGADVPSLIYRKEGISEFVLLHEIAHIMEGSWKSPQNSGGHNNAWWDTWGALLANQPDMDRARSAVQAFGYQFGSSGVVK